MFTVYKIINLETNQYYIGVHKTDNPKDSYLGSGIHITRQVKLYGRDHFKKEILYKFDDEKEAYEKEKELISQNIDNSLCLNIGPGGIGGATFTGRKHSEETKLLISKRMSGKNLSVERRKQISERLKNRPCSEETRLKISEAIKRRHIEGKYTYKTENIGKIAEGLKRYWDKKGRKNKPRNKKREPKSIISSKERVWVYKGDVSYHIYKDELEEYLKLNWKRGRGKCVGQTMSKVLKGKNRGPKNPAFGKVWMYHDLKKEILMVKKELVNEFLELGWKLGNKNKDPAFKKELY